MSLKMKQIKTKNKGDKEVPERTTKKKEDISDTKPEKRKIKVDGVKAKKPSKAVSKRRNKPKGAVEEDEADLSEEDEEQFNEDLLDDDNDEGEEDEEDEEDMNDPMNLYEQDEDEQPEKIDLMELDEDNKDKKRGEKKRSFSKMTSNYHKFEYEHQLKKFKTSKVFIYSGLSEDDRDVLYQTVKKLGRFDIEANKEAGFTHLIYAGNQRTLKLLYALARRAWILEASFVYSSFEFGDWVSEKEYQCKQYPDKQLRDSLGPLFKENAFYVVECEYDTLSYKELKKIVALAGGKHMANAKDAAIVIDNASNKSFDTNTADMGDNKRYLSHKWVLDSVTQYKLLTFNDYAIKL